MKVWITKYALTQGILEKEAEICSTVPDNTMIKTVGSKYPEYYHGSDWHYTNEEAVAKAEKMRRNKIESLRKQIKKLVCMKFLP